MTLAPRPQSLRLLRVALGLTQHELGLRLGVSTPSVHRWERLGHAGRREHLVRLAFVGLRDAMWRESMAKVAGLTARGAEERARVERQAENRARREAALVPAAVAPLEVETC